MTTGFGFSHFGETSQRPTSAFSFGSSYGNKRSAQISDVTYGGHLSGSGSLTSSFSCSWTITKSSLLENESITMLKSGSFKIADATFCMFFSPKEYNAENQHNMVWGLECVEGDVHKKGLAYIAMTLRGGQEVLKEVSGHWCKVETTQKMSYTAKREFLQKLEPDDELKISFSCIYSKCSVISSEGAKWSPEISPLVKLASDYASLYRNASETSDAIISVKENDFKVHTCVLSLRSEVFAAMFKYDMKEKKSRRVVVEDITSDAMKFLLEFVYSGTTHAYDTEIALELLRASDKYELEDLKVFCSNLLISRVNIDNCAEMIVRADMVNAMKLKSFAVEVFCEEVPSCDIEKYELLFIQRPNVTIDIIKAYASKELK